jgi:hypothetical protein
VSCTYRNLCALSSVPVSDVNGFFCVRRHGDFGQGDDSLSACDTISHESRCTSPVRGSSRSVSPERRASMSTSEGQQAGLASPQERTDHLAPKMRLPKLSSSLLVDDQEAKESTWKAAYWNPWKEETSPSSRAARHRFVPANQKTTFTKLCTPVGTKVVIGNCKECLVGTLSEIQNGNRHVFLC